MTVSLSSNYHPHRQKDALLPVSFLSFIFPIFFFSPSARFFFLIDEEQQHHPIPSFLKWGNGAGATIYSKGNSTA